MVVFKDQVEMPGEILPGNSMAYSDFHEASQLSIRSR
jgi:hypothetical protein